MPKHFRSWDRVYAVAKRQRAGAVQKLARNTVAPVNAKRLGVRQPSTAFGSGPPAGDGRAGASGFWRRLSLQIKMGAKWRGAVHSRRRAFLDGKNFRIQFALGEVFSVWRKDRGK